MRLPLKGALKVKEVAGSPFARALGRLRTYYSFHHSFNRVPKTNRVLIYSETPLLMLEASSRHVRLKEIWRKKGVFQRISVHAASKSDRIRLFSYPFRLQASSLSHSARYRILLEQAEQTLTEKELEYEQACSLRQCLLSRVDLLERLASPSRACLMLQLIALRTCDLRPIAGQRPATLSLSINALAFESLPASLNQYSEDLLKRVGRMTPGDLAHVYGSFVTRSAIAL